MLPEHIPGAGLSGAVSLAQGRAASSHTEGSAAQRRWARLLHTHSPFVRPCPPLSLLMEVSISKASFIGWSRGEIFITLVKSVD